MATEAAARRDGFVGGDAEKVHKRSLTDPDARHWLTEGEDGRALGYAILRGLTNPNRSLELKRLTLAVTGGGYGRETLRLIKKLAFEPFGAHRLWLDVYTHNARARHVYLTEGFVVEGTLRECVLLGDAYASLEVMSLLEGEWRLAASGRRN